MTRTLLALTLLLVTLPTPADPQLKTAHPFYPGELACSSFPRLFKTQADLYTRVTGRPVASDEDKALASWYWRNLHYFHGEEGKCDLFGQGFDKTDWNREYWSGLFAHGFALCGTTHSQWTAEFNALLGHCRSRAVGVAGHNSFEVFLTGGPYGRGKWALLDHDISTVLFAPDGARLLGIAEIVPQAAKLKDPQFNSQNQRGWRVSGLAPEDAGAVYTANRAAEYLSGYAGPPPVHHLRPGESLRRYLHPGLEDGQTFVFWGANYNTAGTPGPERSRTWVNQPDKMYNAKSDAGHRPGQARYANAVYIYTPNFRDGSYKQGVVNESDDSVTFEFRSPYVIAATPPNASRWGVYDKGGRNGLQVTAKRPIPVELSTDCGKTWSPTTTTDPGTPLDLTDLAKGHYQYLLRINQNHEQLEDVALSIRTVCQANAATLPRLTEGQNTITFADSALALVSAGPTQPQAAAHVVDGALGSKTVTLELTPPRGEKAVTLYAAAWINSGNPPAPVKHQVDYSTDAGQTWRPVAKDWQLLRRPPEPPDFWSQSFCWADTALPSTTGPVRVRFRNDGNKTYRNVEAHLAYRVSNPTPTRVTFAWRNPTGDHSASHDYPANTVDEDSSWTFDAGQNVDTRWVEYTAP